MNFFSIDCSTETGSIFIKTKNKTFSKVLQSYKFNNDLLVKEILDFFVLNSLSFNDISKIFVNQGPGNFSGLRISIAVAKGISLSKNLKLLGYNTFIWAGSKFLKENNIFFSLIIFRKKFFIKKIDKNLNVISEIQEVDEKDLLKKYNDKIVVIPSNIKKHLSDKILSLSNLKIVDLDHNELEFLELNGLLEEQLIRPLYLN